MYTFINGFKIHNDDFKSSLYETIYYTNTKKIHVLITDSRETQHIIKKLFPIESIDIDTIHNLHAEMILNVNVSFQIHEKRSKILKRDLELFHKTRNDVFINFANIIEGFVPENDDLSLLQKLREYFVEDDSYTMISIMIINGKRFNYANICKNPEKNPTCIDGFNVIGQFLIPI
jgi:hypothetical protein